MTGWWWITTGPLPEGKKVLGPFGSQELALDVRGYMDPDGKRHLWVDEEGGES